MLDASSIPTVLRAYRPERDALVDLLRSISAEDWALRTECPSYDIKGIAIHVLGDDLSLLSRQRDSAENGLVQIAAEFPGADFGTVLDTFNDRWVEAARFMSVGVILELLALTGEWTASYYENVDPESDGEPVGLFGDHGSSSPFWKAIAREYMERWVHHSQIRRALDRGPLAEPLFVEVGVTIAAATTGIEPTIPTDSSTPWSLGPIVLGDRVQAANILTKGLTAEQIRAVAGGPADAVDLLALFAGRT